MLLSEIHHRVKNNLEVVSSLLELQSVRLTHPSAQEAIRAGQSRVSSMGEKWTVSKPLLLRPKHPLADVPYDLSDRIFVHHKNKLVKIGLEDILYAEAERSYCRIFTKETEYLLSMPLSKIEAKLPSKYFLRIHRSYMINLKHVEEIGDSYVKLINKKLSITRAKREELLRNIRSM